MNTETTENQEVRTHHMDWRFVALLAGILMISLLVSHFTSRTEAPGLSGEAIRCALPKVLEATMAPFLAEFYKTYKIDVSVTSGQSQQLADELLKGADYDVFLFEDIGILEKLEKANLISTDIPNNLEILYDVPSLLIKKFNPRGIADHHNLFEEGTRIAIESPDQSGMGQVGYEFLKKINLFPTANHSVTLHRCDFSSALQAISKDQLDVLIGYRFLHYAFPNQIDIIYIPDEALTGFVVFRGVTLLKSKDHNASAALLNLLGSKSTRDLLSNKGYIAYRNMIPHVAPHIEEEFSQFKLTDEYKSIPVCEFK